MITEDQTPVIEFLAAPSTHGGAPVERIETHASIVFLAGDARVEAQARRPLRLPRLLDGRAPQGAVRGGGAPQPPHGAALLPRRRRRRPQGRTARLRSAVLACPSTGSSR